MCLIQLLQNFQRFHCIIHNKLIEMMYIILYYLLTMFSEFTLLFKNISWKEATTKQRSLKNPVQPKSTNSIISLCSLWSLSMTNCTLSLFSAQVRNSEHNSLAGSSSCRRRSTDSANSLAVACGLENCFLNSTFNSVKIDSQSVLIPWSEGKSPYCCNTLWACR